MELPKKHSPASIDWGAIRTSFVPIIIAEKTSPLDVPLKHHSSIGCCLIWVTKRWALELWKIAGDIIFIGVKGFKSCYSLKLFIYEELS